MVDAHVIAPPHGETREAATIVARDLRIDGKSREVQVRGRQVHLTRKEFDLLFFLARHAGRTFSRLELLLAVWGSTFERDPATVNVHVRRLRAKIERTPRSPQHVITVWGVGYRFRI